MLYYGVVKTPSSAIDCRPCIIQGNYVKKDNVVLISSGVILYKRYDKARLIVISDDITETKDININDLLFLIAKNEQCEVVKV